MSLPFSTDTIRRAADDEVSASLAARVAEAAGEDEAVRGAIEFERSLRSAIGRVMTSDEASAAPADLAERIRAELRAAPETAAPAPTGSDAPETTAPAPLPLRSRRRPVVPSALAAGLALLITAALAATLLLDGRAGFEPAGPDKPVIWAELPDFRESVARTFGDAIEIPDLHAAGYVFERGKIVSVPGPVRGTERPVAHIRYRVEDGDGRGATLFVQRRTGRNGETSWTHDLLAGVPYEIRAGGPADPGDPISFAWVRNGLLYILDLDDRADALEVAHAAGLPAGEPRLRVEDR